MYRTRFLTLNQPMVGQEKKYGKEKKRRPYRGAGDAPTVGNEGEKTFFDRFIEKDEEEEEEDIDMEYHDQYAMNAYNQDSQQQQEQHSSHPQQYRDHFRTSHTDDTQYDKKVVSSPPPEIEQTESSAMGGEKEEHAEPQPKKEMEEIDLDNLDTLDVPETIPDSFTDTKIKVEKLKEEIDNSDSDSDMDDLRMRARLKARLKSKMNESNLAITETNENFVISPAIKKEETMGRTIKDDPNDDSSEYTSNDDDNSDDESDSDDSDESDTDEDETMGNTKHRKFKPVFLTKNDRERLESAIGMEEEAQLIESAQDKRKKELDKETRSEVIDYIRERERRDRNDSSDEEMPDDNDDDDAETQFELWKVRELKRIKRDTEEESKRITDETQLQMRREMTDREIEAENRKLGIKQKKPKEKMKFMTKYYHAGAFFRDDTIVDEELLQRNFMEPTGKDKWTDYEKVAAPYKTRRFGLMSQTKWTHLAAEDTTEKYTEKVDGRDKIRFVDYRKLDDNRRFSHKSSMNERVIRRGGEGALKRPSLKDKRKKKQSSDHNSSHSPRNNSRYDRR